MKLLEIKYGDMIIATIFISRIEFILEGDGKRGRWDIIDINEQNIGFLEGNSVNLTGHESQSAKVIAEIRYVRNEKSKKGELKKEEF